MEVSILNQDMLIRIEFIMNVKDAVKEIIQIQDIGS